MVSISKLTFNYEAGNSRKFFVVVAISKISGFIVDLAASLFLFTWKGAKIDFSQNGVGVELSGF